MDATIRKPRRAWLAAVLSLLGGPLGQVYAGRFRRAVLLWIVGGAVLPAAVLASVALPLGRYSFALLCTWVLGYPVFLAIDAFLVARRHRHAPLKRYQRWWIYLLVFVALYAGNQGVARVLRAFVAEAFVAPGGAMVPTIQSGDRILVDKMWCGADRLQRNDVVVFRSEGPGSALYIMRVAGLPGEEIEIRDERVHLNGTVWDDPHAVLTGDLPPLPEIANFGPLTIPSDCFFVLGDNRRKSKDSRMLGPIPLSDLYGKARMVYWSRHRTFPDPRNPWYHEAGAVRWDRIGARLD